MKVSEGILQESKMSPYTDIKPYIEGGDLSFKYL